jgi:uncharacterized protein
MVIPTPRRLSIPMRDGIALVGDLYLPAPTGVFPTLLCKTPYDRTRPAVYPEIASFLDHGYAVLIVSFRGRFGSEGLADEWKTEGWGPHLDGYDTVEWAAAQPWSTGNVGVYGISADGQWQLTTAATRPPHLKAAFAAYAAHGRAGLMDGGIYTSVGPRWHAMTGMFNVDLGSREEWQAWLDQWRETEAPQLMSFMHRGLLDIFQHTEYDEYWKSFDPAEKYDEFEIPVYYECGWYDRYTGSQFTHFQGVRERARSDHARKGQKIIAGPWLHGGNLAAQNETVKFSEVARSHRIELMVRWFDRWLKGIENGIETEPPISVYVGGADEWLESDEWPPAGVSDRTLFLAAGDGRAEGSLNGGVLSTEPPAGGEAPDSYEHDPYDPVPTIGGHGGVSWMWPSGPLDQREAEARCLTYTTDVLTEDLQVVGEPRIELRATSTAVDTDFIATLSDVHPNGYSEIVRQGGVRGRNRGGRTTTELITPGEITTFPIDMTPVAHRFRAGHRLRLTVASSSFPNFLPNAGTAEPPYLATRAVKATNAIYHDAGNRSTISLPVHPG